MFDCRRLKLKSIFIIFILILINTPQLAQGSPPVINPVPIHLVVEEGGLLNFIVTAYDDGGPTILTAENLPPHSTFIDWANDTASCQIQPLVGDAGCYVVSFLSQDSEGLSDTTQCIIVIEYAAGGSIGICAGVSLSSTSLSRNSFIDFGAFPLPADYFGPGSDPFDGIISLEGERLETQPPDALGSTDMIINRLDTALLPSCGSTDQIPIELVALSLVSASPITVTYNGGQNPEQWDVRVCLSSAVPQDQGTMTITQDCEEGGSFSASLPVRPKFIFTKVNPPNDQLTYDFGAEGIQSISLDAVDGSWLFTDPGFGVVVRPGDPTAVDHDCDGIFDIEVDLSSNFYPGLQGLSCDCSNGPSDYLITTTVFEDSQSAMSISVIPPQEVPDSIPTLNEWGMLILALLLIGAASVAIIRRRKLATSED